MRTKIAFITSLVALGALPGVAWAQDAAPAAAGAAPAAGAPAAAAPAEPAPAAAAPAAPAAAEPAPAAAPAAAGPTPWPGWIRVDHDGGALQVWGGATAPLADGIGLAFDMYVNSGFMGEFDIGPAIAVSTLTLTPMIGLQFDWSDRKLAAVVPQLYLTGPIGDKLYNELWIQYYNYKLTKYQDAHAGYTFLYAREFLDYKISDWVGVGPQIELTQNFTAGQLQSLPVGGNVMLNMGANSTLFFFLGYETNKNSNTYPTGADPMTGLPTGTEKHAATGRLTFVHNF